MFMLEIRVIIDEKTNSNVKQQQKRNLFNLLSLQS